MYFHKLSNVWNCKTKVNAVKIRKLAKTYAPMKVKNLWCKKSCHKVIKLHKNEAGIQWLSKNQSLFSCEIRSWSLHPCHFDMLSLNIARNTNWTCYTTEQNMAQKYSHISEKSLFCVGLDIVCTTYYLVFTWQVHCMLYNINLLLPKQYSQCQHLAYRSYLLQQRWELQI